MESGRCLRVLEGHNGRVWSVAWSDDGSRVLSGSSDRTVRLWEVESGRCLRVFEGHEGGVSSLAWRGENGPCALSGSWDKTVRVWELESGRCLRVLEGHDGKVRSVAWSGDGRRAFSASENGVMREWELGDLVSARPLAAPDQVQYTNAKILLVGDPGAGKTCLTHRLATGKWSASGGSTVGVWSTQWKLKYRRARLDLDREVWLWDFGGQADQRLVHQLYMDRAALILLLFNADQEDVQSGLRDWLTALRHTVPAETPRFLVAGRIDTGFKASRSKLQNFIREQGLQYHETSAQAGTGCDALRDAIVAGIPWDLMEQRTSPRTFKVIKDAVLKLRDEGAELVPTFKELREALRRRLPSDLDLTDEALRTVIGLLDGPGVVKELVYGTYVLLAPEWVNTYAQAVIRTLRAAKGELGCLPIRSIAEGKLVYQSVGCDGVPVETKRLPPDQERVVLGEMERQLLERGLCLRQGDKLVFPSHCGRERDVVPKHPPIFVSYAVKGFLDDLYATLVVKLADSQAFRLLELWRDAADFVTLDGVGLLGVKLARDSASDGEIKVYCGLEVTPEQQVIFANYVHAHIADTAEKVERMRHYVCPHCSASKGNPLALTTRLLKEGKQADTECDGCGKRFKLWDKLEMLFASKNVRERVEGLRAGAAARLDSRRKGKLLVLEVGARITSANQKWHEVPHEEDEGIDIEVEFTDDEGKGTGRRLYLQLKAGSSHLTRRRDGVEVFRIKKQAWVTYWLKQPHPVMLVIGTIAEEDERRGGMDRIHFADVRWMEISSILMRESSNGKRPVRHIEFSGERLDMESVYRVRAQAPRADPPPPS